MYSRFDRAGEGWLAAAQALRRALHVRLVGGGPGTAQWARRSPGSPALSCVRRTMTPSWGRHTSTTAFEPGGSARPNDRSAALAVVGNAERSVIPGPDISSRWWRVSASRRITRDIAPSRCLRASRRSSACRSLTCVSASTPIVQPTPLTTASQARKSRGPSTDAPPIGTSVRHRSPGPNRAWKRPSRATCAASRSGVPAREAPRAQVQPHERIELGDADHREFSRSAAADPSDLLARETQRST